MRILHADTDDLENPLRGGQPVRTFEIYSRLAARHEITVFTSVYKGCRRRVQRAGVDYRRLGFRLPPFGLSPHMSFLAALGPRVWRTPHDLVVEEFCAPVGFCLLPWWTKRPVISLIQWYFLDFWERRYHLPFSRWMRWIAARQYYRYFIVQSEAMARTVRGLAPAATVRCIPCGVSGEAFLSDNPGPGQYVLYFGRLDEWQKGLDLLCDAWRAVCAPAGIPLVIAGAGPAREALERRVAAGGLTHLVKFAGRVEGQAKADALRNCRLLVMPSRAETFGITALEGMAAGKPVVSFDIEHLNELVRAPWGATVAPFDTGALGRTVMDLWNNPEGCAAMGRAARQEAANYTWDRLAQAQEAFYQEVVESSKR